MGHRPEAMHKASIYEERVNPAEEVLGWEVPRGTDVHLLTRPGPAGAGKLPWRRIPPARSQNAPVQLVASLMHDNAQLAGRS